MRRAEERDDRQRAQAARDVPPGVSWIFTDHRTMAEVMRDEDTRIVARPDGGYEVVG